MSAYEDLIQDAAQRHRLDPDWIKAIIQVESHWDPMTTPRWEPHQQQHSYGLGQFLPSTVLWIAATPQLFVLPEDVRSEILTAAQALPLRGEAVLNKILHDPRNAIELIATYLAYNLRRYNWNLSDAVAAYNAGSVRKTSSGNYVNQWHVDKFLDALDVYKGE